MTLSNLALAPRCFRHLEHGNNYAHLGGLTGTRWCWSTWQGHVHGSVLFRSWLQEEYTQIWLSAGDPRPAWRHRALEGATEPTACSVFPLLP